MLVIECLVDGVVYGGKFFLVKIIVWVVGV